MTTNRRNARLVAFLSLVIGSSLTLDPRSTHAGPISEMLARHRSQKQLKLPPMDKPFSSKPPYNFDTKTTSLTDRFKKRFSIRRGSSEGIIPLNKDMGLIKTSR